MPQEAYLATPRPGGYIPRPQAYPLRHLDVDAESGSSLDGWAMSHSEHVAETAYLAPRMLDSSGMSPPMIPSALEYDHYRYSEETPSDRGYAANRWDSRFSYMQHAPSQPLADVDERSFMPQPFMYDAGGLSPGASEESSIQFRGGQRYHLNVHSAVWPSGEGLQHEQVQTMDNETAQEAQFGIVHSQTYSCGRNAHMHVGRHQHFLGPHQCGRLLPPTHAWQEQWAPEGPPRAPLIGASTGAMHRPKMSGARR
ncbi:hypothetical protein C8Q78DRAFT_356256 [Trametes maxima]|nr:hypothetical protein C8Q78DRAFT_356256 [Trametes maxima]